MKVTIIDDVVYVLSEMRIEAIKSTKELIRQKQVELYVDRCAEPSSEIVEGRIYEI